MEKRIARYDYISNRLTDFSEAAPGLARRGRRGGTVPALARPLRRSRHRHSPDDGRTRLRIGRPRVVAVLQPRAVGRARGRYRPDSGRARCDQTRRARIHCGRRDGDVALRLRHPGPEPRPRRLGRGKPAPFPVQRASARIAGRCHSDGVRSVYAPANRWHQR